MLTNRKMRLRNMVLTVLKPGKCTKWGNIRFVQDDWQHEGLLLECHLAEQVCLSRWVGCEWRRGRGKYLQVGVPPKRPGIGFRHTYKVGAGEV